MKNVQPQSERYLLDDQRSRLTLPALRSHSRVRSSTLWPPVFSNHPLGDVTYAVEVLIAMVAAQDSQSSGCSRRANSSAAFGFSCSAHWHRRCIHMECSAESTLPGFNIATELSVRKATEKTRSYRGPCR